MTAATTIITYLGEGTHAARPATPNLPTGGIGFYYETDTTTLFLYNVAGAVWIAVGSIAGGASALLDTLGSTQGDVLYRGASAWTVLAPGTSGQVLTTQGAAANPHWAAGGGGGAGVTVTQKTGDYTVLSTDPGNLYEWEDSAAVAITLPQSTGAFFPNGSAPLYIQNNGSAGSAITITPTTSAINGNATLVLGAGMGALIVGNGTDYFALYTAPVGASNADQVGTVSLTSAGAMLGLAEYITPQRTGTVLASFTGNINATDGGGFIQVKYGTGTAPGYNAATTGTSAGALLTVATTGRFASTVLISGLTLGTRYWLDFEAGTTSAMLTLANINISEAEL